MFWSLLCCGQVSRLNMAAYVSGAVLPVDGALSERGAGWLGRHMGDMLRVMPDTCTD